MNLRVYERYVEEMLFQSPKSTIEYQNATTRLMRTDQGLFLLGRIGVPPSWKSNPVADRHYFSKPGRLSVFIPATGLVGSPLIPEAVLKNWPDPDPLFQEAVGKDRSAISDILFYKLKNICLFGDRTNTTNYFYLGTATLTGISICPEVWHLCYALETKLSQEFWTKFGGYRGWLMTIGMQEFDVSSYDEARNLLDSFWGKTDTTLEITRYEGDMLRAGVNKENQAFVMHSSSVGMETYSGSYEPEGKWTSFDKYNDAFEVPTSTLISRKCALQIVESYMTTGDVWKNRFEGKDCN